MKARFLLLPVLFLGLGTVQAGDKPPADARPLSEIVLALEKQGYSPIVDVEFDDGRWEIDAYREDRRRDLKVDPRSGKILSDRPDD